MHQDNDALCAEQTSATAFFPCAVPELRTARLMLRAVQPTDRAELVELLLDPVMNRSLHNANPSRADCEQLVERWLATYSDTQPQQVRLQWLITHATTSTILGTISLSFDQGRFHLVTVGYCVGSAHWHQGYASEALSAVRDFAFQVAGVGKLEGRCAISNVASLNTMRKVGMRIELRQRQAGLSNGTVVDGYLLGLNRPDYQILHPAWTPPAQLTTYQEQLRTAVIATHYPKFTAAQVRHLGTLPLETPRLSLRRIPRDAGEVAFHTWLSDPEVTKYLSYPTYTSVAQADERMRIWNDNYSNPDFYLWAIYRKEDDALMGTISFEPHNALAVPAANIGYCIGKAFWGQGYMSEAVQEIMRFAFVELGLPIIHIGHHINNVGSARVIAKAGLSFQGALTYRYGICSDCPADSCWYDITAADFFAQHPEYARATNS